MRVMNTDAATVRVESREYSRALSDVISRAYSSRDDTPQRRPKPRKPIRFSVIAYNVTVGKVIRVPK